MCILFKNHNSETSFYPLTWSIEFLTIQVIITLFSINKIYRVLHGWIYHEEQEDENNKSFRMNDSLSEFDSSSFPPILTTKNLITTDLNNSILNNSIANDSQLFCPSFTEHDGIILDHFRYWVGGVGVCIVSITGFILCFISALGKIASKYSTMACFGFSLWRLYYLIFRVAFAYCILRMVSGDNVSSD